MTKNYWLLRRALININKQAESTIKKIAIPWWLQLNHKFTGYKQRMPIIDVCFRHIMYSDGGRPFYGRKLLSRSKCKMTLTVESKYHEYQTAQILSSLSITCTCIVQTFKAFVNALFSLSSTKERRT